MTRPTDNVLKEFCRWHVCRYGAQRSERSTFITCLCGRFHTYPKAAELILQDLKVLGLVEVKAGKVRVLTAKE